MERIKRGLSIALIVVGYVTLAGLMVFFVSKSGVYPSGDDTMCHIYKGDILYHSIKEGDWYPLWDSRWYNGVQNMRYWAPLPVYVLAMCQGIAGGDAIYGYLVFLFLTCFLSSLVWLRIGCTHKRPWMGAFLGFLWFFMPNNLMAVFVEGNLPRALCVVMLPLFVSFVHDYLLEDKWVGLPKMIVCFGLMTLCHIGYACMIALSLLVFLIIFKMLYPKKGRVSNVFLAVALGFMLTGIWTYGALQGGITAMDSSQAMKNFFQSAWETINPLLRLKGTFGFYFGLAAFVLMILGMLMSKRESMPGFWTGFVIFVCTTNVMYGVLVHFPGSQFLWMLRFISIALCFVLYSWLLWKSLKKPFVMLLAFLLVLDVIPSLSLIHGGLKFTSPKDRYEALEDSTLIGEAKEITNQRLTLLDASSLGADGAYLVSRYEDGVPATFGAGWQSAATAHNIVQLNQAMGDGCYLYLFDRCLEMGSDTVLVQVSQLQNKENDVEKVDEAGKKLGYKLVSTSPGYRLYHKDTQESFGVVSHYSAIGIGTSAPLMSLQFPMIEERDETNLNAYTYEELSQYDVIYLAGFTYSNRDEAEDMLLRLSRHGVRVVILADGIPVDEATGEQSFLGVNCQKVTFSNGYPELDTVDGLMHCDLFPEGHTQWNTVYLNGLKAVMGTTTDLNREFAFYGTGDNENLVFVGLNLTYHYALTGDSGVGTLLSHAFGLKDEDLPKRKLVSLTISYQQDKITITSEYNQVNTTLAAQDIFSSKQKTYAKNHLLYVDKGKTVITMSYPYLKEGWITTVIALLLTGGFLYYTKKRIGTKQNG
ncbi:MAG: 6-pyruvoyl-tetrahydropterin synthase-related protein [Lachnospiraceae bacterium]|nr:6-pyruvoyl-tetrahydropterin synthase-related protein [Lachnospiraceae bacterium]